MKIEVACMSSESKKQKGDLLEGLSKRLLEALGYDVIEEIRIIGAELDLLCKHKVSGRKIYVECKAQKDLISAPILRQLWGTVDCEEYSEGWLISTSGLTKEAKGFVENWNNKPKEKSERLSFYYPERVIEALCNASIIMRRPDSSAESFIEKKNMLGEWVLLVSQFGMYWCVYTLKGGAPHGVLVFDAETNKQIVDTETINNLASLDSTITEYDLYIGCETSLSAEYNSGKLPTVVEVQIGESWDDYRPARPQDFVGRDELQKAILRFIDSAKSNNGSRVFAITGNSGLGKSSLIAKLRDRSRNQFYRKRYFVFAVDMRGARSPLYILSSLVECLLQAQENGFGDKSELNITDPSAPINSPSIKTYLDSLDSSGQVVCLVFDQFEELYSKPDLFGVFKAAKDLMLDIAGSKRNFVLGFAWKTDSTTQQDHPAYHMWHEVSDHRREYRLDVFDNGEISKSITKFEKEIGEKVSAQSRHQIANSSQGFPWLLKKLCINLYEGIAKGDVAESLYVDLDAGRLFESDLESLSTSEHACLKLVAQKAPADWSEIIETSGPVTLNSLVHKRLVIKSGDRLNVYWDIFRDYLLTGKVPTIPFNYVPTTDPSSMLRICKLLNGSNYENSVELSNKASLKEKTIWNIGADLVMFGLAERDGTSFKLHRSMQPYSDDTALKLLRNKLARHSLKLELYKKYAGRTIEQDKVKEELINSLPSSKFGDKTWQTYANRLTNFLIYTGFLARHGYDVIVRDLGAPISDGKGIGRRGSSLRKGKVFSVSVSPYAVCSELKKISGGMDSKADSSRNALAVLKRFELVKVTDDKITPNKEAIEKYGGEVEAVWSVARNEDSLMKCMELINKDQEISTLNIAESIANHFGLKWSEGSKTRNGAILKQWSCWIKEGMEKSSIPSPPGRPNKTLHQTSLSLGL